MRAVDIIIKKRDKQELNQEEIEFFVHGFTTGEIPDYQVSAWAMAVLLNGMTDQETTFLTQAMAHSGDILDLSSISSIVVDKHSTGGVGDKTTLVVAPLVAACGLKVGKMSGRGLGFSGGTLDKLESIPGYRVDLSVTEFLQQLKDIGVVVTGQSADLAPADGKLYGLRDVTGTVPAMPLIASSVMSKKIAAGANVIVLDVKVGMGAFMTNLADARKLGEMMVAIGSLSGKKVRAILSDMNQPLGEAVGNAMELKEAIEALHGAGPADLREHCLELACHLLEMGGISSNLEGARKIAKENLDNGSAWKKFRQLVEAQGGDVSYIDHPEKLPQAPFIETVHAQRCGYLSKVNARIIGETSVAMGAGREKKGDMIDLEVGILVHCKVGDEVKEGQKLFTIHSKSQEAISNIRKSLLSSLEYVSDPCERLPLFYGLIR